MNRGPVGCAPGAPELPGIGSEIVAYRVPEDWEVHGVDNNLRADFFGPQGDMLETYDSVLPVDHALEQPARSREVDPVARLTEPRRVLRRKRMLKRIDRGWLD